MNGHLLREVGVYLKISQSDPRGEVFSAHLRVQGVLSFALSVSSRGPSLLGKHGAGIGGFAADMNMDCGGEREKLGRAYNDHSWG
jgi:hypothetical protein